MDFLILPLELQIHVLAFLSTKERAGLPLVCKALNELAKAPELWETLDLMVTPQHKDDALESTTRRLLQARARHTKALTLRFAYDLPVPWRSVFATMVPPLCPHLQTLVMDSGYYFRADDAQFLLESCSTLQALRIGLLSEGFSAGLQSISRIMGLTSLQLRKFCTPATISELQEAVQHLPTQLRTLELAFDDCDFELPACLPKRMLQLESLCLSGCNLRLPASLSKLHCLTALRVNESVGWANLWPAVSGLPSLQELDVRQNEEAALPPLHGAAFSTCLTGLTCWGIWRDAEQAQAAGSLLALPKLQSLEVHRMSLTPRLDWGSLTSLAALSCDGRGQDFEQILQRLSGLSRLTHLRILRGDNVTGEVVAELCRMGSLRSLDLVETCMTTLPEAMASAQLTALDLEYNCLLSFDPAAYSILDSMPALQILNICVCYMDNDEAPAKTPRSMAFLRAISKGLDICSPCECHDEA